MVSDGKVRLVNNEWKMEKKIQLRFLTDKDPIDPEDIVKAGRIIVAAADVGITKFQQASSVDRRKCSGLA